MGYFTEALEDKESLAHFGILGQRWHRRNGPPYPLDAGDHSAAQKTAAKAAGIKVGQDSGKGSIDNIKKPKSGGVSKSPKKELTPEEKREAAMDAALKGDKKKIVKNMDQLTTEELRAAEERARLRDNLTKKDPNDKTMSKADMEKMDAIRSGDKEKVKQYADKMSYQELKEAMDKVDLTAKLNHVDPPKSTMDKIDEVVKTVDKVRDWAEKGIDAYNVIARVHNAANKDSAWPLIKGKGDDKKNDDKKDDKKNDSVEKAINKIANDVQKSNSSKSETTNKELSAREQAKEELKRKKLAYDTQKKYNDYVSKEENKKAEKEAKQQKKAEEKAQKEQEREEAKAAREQEKAEERARSNVKFNADTNTWSGVNYSEVADEPISSGYDSTAQEYYSRYLLEDKS